MRKALKVTPKGEVIELDLDSPGGAYGVLSEAVEGSGMIEPVGFGEGEFYCDENYWAEYEDSPENENRVALTFWDQAFPGHRNRFLGPVIFTGGVDEEGETAPVTPSIESAVRTVAANVRLLFSVLG